MFTKVKFFQKNHKKVLTKRNLKYKMFTERNGGEKMVIVKDKEKLKRDIILAGFSITSLAKEVGCSKAHISSIVNHERNPSGTIAVKICEQIKGKFDDYFFIESVHKKELKR